MSSVVVVTCAAAGWGISAVPSNEPSLDVVVSYNNYQFDIVWYESTVGSTFTSGPVALCVSGGGSATITAVEPVESIGVEIADFGTGADSLSTLETLDELGVDSRTVSTPCAPDVRTQTAANVTFVDLEMVRTTPGRTAVIQSARATWRIGAVNGSTVFPVRLTLCDPEDVVEQCVES